jgi:hypothetical protein
MPTPTPAAPPTKLSAETARAIQRALAAEQVAVWAYDVVAAYDPADADLIATIKAGHLARADATTALLVAGGSKAPSPAPAYALPKPVTDLAGARALSDVIEADVAAAWRGVIGATDNTVIRNAGLAGLSDSAVWLTSLKLAANTNPATLPFPGQG